MSITEIIKDSFSYGVSDLKKLFILGIIFIISNLATIFLNLHIMDNTNSGSVSLILMLIGYIISFVTAGYGLSVIHDSYNGSNSIPSLDLLSNFVLGIKNFILDLVYGIVLGIILLIISYATGFISVIVKLLNELAINPNLNAVSSTLLNQFASSAFVFFILALIIVFIFYFFRTIASCRLATTNSLTEGLNIMKVIDDIKKIGILNYIIWLIFVLICMGILSIIALLIDSIPFVGCIISFLVISPLALLFFNRALASLYSEVE